MNVQTNLASNLDAVLPRGLLAGGVLVDLLEEELDTFTLTPSTTPEPEAPEASAAHDTKIFRSLHPSGRTSTATTTDLLAEHALNTTALATAERSLTTVTDASLTRRRGRRARRQPSPDAHKAARLIAEAAASRSSKEAYASFERLTIFVLRSIAEDIFEPIRDYLKRMDAQHRSVLLSCLADHDVELTDRRLLHTIAQLCASTDRELARAAAAALASAGDVAGEVLDSTLCDLAEPRRSDLANFVAFTSTI